MTITTIPAVSPAGWIIIGSLLWVAWVFCSRWLLDNPREEIDAGVFWRFCRVYSRWVQRLRIIGAENMPRTRPGGPLILVSNHTSGVDVPVLTAAGGFEVRWIMAADMRTPLIEPFWDWANVIMVDRQKKEAGGTREAVRHLKEGGVVGIFPEGGIEKEPETLMPFHAGIGLIIRRSGAPVLPVIVRGTSKDANVWGAYLKRGNAVLEFKPRIHYDASMSAQDIAADLQKRYQEWTGWRVVDPSPPESPRDGAAP